MLQGTREDLLAVLTFAMGAEAAQRQLNEIEDLIRKRAAEGTSIAITKKIPEIRSEVREEAMRISRNILLATGGIAILITGAAMLSKRS